MRIEMWGLMAMAVGVVACGTDDQATGAGGGGQGGSAAGPPTSGTGGTGNGGSASGGAPGTGGGVGPGGGGAGGAANVTCDYQTVNGMIVIEAEDLPLSGTWQVATDEADYTGSGYILWTGASQNNNPGEGLISVALHIQTAGRYQLAWRNRIGMGTNTTEHNDTWLRLPDATGYYGMKMQDGLESRRYPKPSCEDQTLMDTILSSPDVGSAQCPNGSTSDGWLKVYSSGASDWSWSTRTSDNDAHDIYVEFGQPGVYTMELSARADYHLIDRIVLREESIEDGTAQDLAATPTPCP